jgi:hypothetical protein
MTIPMIAVVQIIEYRESNIEYQFSKETGPTMSLLMVTICNLEASNNP